jgi:hypothetical protein
VYVEIVELDRIARERVAFYIDIIMFIVVAVSIVSLALHSYAAGMRVGGESYINAQQEMMYVAASVAFLSVAMTWIFIRYFKKRSARGVS